MPTSIIRLRTRLRRREADFAIEEKRMFRKLVIPVLLAVMCAFAQPCAAATAKPVSLSTAWLDEYEAFVMWLARDKGWDKEIGLDVKMTLYSSGPAMIDGLSLGEWRFGAMGALPAMLGYLRLDMSVIGNGNDESLCNGVVLPQDSPIAKEKGLVPDHPDVLGSADAIRGKTFYTSVGTSAHYALYSWLSAFGLKQQDIKLRNVDQGQAVSALVSRTVNGGVALWAPELFGVLERGDVMAGTVRDCGKTIPIVLVAETGYAEANPEMAAKFLSVYLRAVKFIRSTNPEALVPDYQRFCKDFGGRLCDEKLALNDLKYHPVFTLEEQLDLFDTSSGPSQAQKWQSDMADFYFATERINEENYDKVKNAGYVTDKYLRLVNTEFVNKN